MPIALCMFAIKDTLELAILFKFHLEKIFVKFLNFKISFERITLLWIL